MTEQSHNEMMRNAMSDDEFDDLAMPPDAQVPKEHKLWNYIDAALREVYDPEIPVNVFELGLIYTIQITDNVGKDDAEHDIFVEMTLTSPGCPVAGEMPGMVQSALFPIEGVRGVEVELIWDPPWDPSKMAETAKLQLNMFT